jgi:ribosomal protein S18 acetylase RimI-like enzyme
VITIRPVQLADAEAIEDRLLYDEVTDAETVALVGGNETLARSYLRKAMQAAHLPLEEWQCVVAVDGDKVVGLLDYSSDGMSRVTRLALLYEVVGWKQFVRAMPIMYGRQRVNTPMPLHAFHLVNLRIDEAHRGRGIGTALLEWGENAARERGYRRIALQTVTSSRAIKLYERLGYRITKSRNHRLYMHDDGRCVMEKSLGVADGERAMALSTTGRS